MYIVNSLKLCICCNCKTYFVLIITVICTCCSTETCCTYYSSYNFFKTVNSLYLFVIKEFIVNKQSDKITCSR